jgi:primosomal replication protein N
MKDLNSVLIEGTIKGRPSIEVTKSGIKTCRFVIISTGYLWRVENRLMKEGELPEKTYKSNIEIEARDLLAEKTEKEASPGRSVRIVGMLKEIREKDISKLIVVAENIDFKPIYKDSVEPEKSVTPAKQKKKTKLS